MRKCVNATTKNSETIILQPSIHDINEMTSSKARDSNTVENEPLEKITPLFKWGQIESNTFTGYLHDMYEKIVFWRSNLFLLPSGNAGKQYIREITRLINAWTDNSPLKEIALKAVMVMPALLLQKPSKNSKAKDHTSALSRRLILWEKGDLPALYHEATTIQSRLPNMKYESSTAKHGKWGSSTECRYSQHVTSKTSRISGSP